MDEANAPLPDIELKTNNNITDVNVSIHNISDIIQILHPNKASGPDVISHRMLKLCPNNIAYLHMFLIILNVQKDSLCITGIELGEHAHHMNPS